MSVFKNVLGLVRFTELPRNRQVSNDARLEMAMNIKGFFRPAITLKTAGKRVGTVLPRNKGPCAVGQNDRSARIGVREDDNGANGR